MTRWRTTAAALLLGLIGGDPALAATRFVSTNGAHVSPFTSWANAATSLAAAVNVAVNNDIVLISNGVFRLTNQITVSRNILITSVNGPASTTVDGRGLHRCFYVNVNGVRFAGLTFTNGYGGAGTNGAAIYFNRNGTASNCWFLGNRAVDRGGACYVNNQAVLITDSLFRDNSGIYGAGAFLSSNGVISNCTFIANKSVGGPGTGGGGVYIQATGLVTRSTFRENTVGNDGGGVLMENNGTVLNCRFYDNVAGDWGGAVASYYAPGGTVRNCEIAANEADDGGAIYCYNGGTIDSCTIVSNRANTSGAGVRCDDGGTMRNTILYYNIASNYQYSGAAPQFASCCTWPAVPVDADAGGNFTNTPGLLYLPDGQLHLATNSPCRNAGTNQAWMTTGRDLDLDARVIGGTVDVGADEVGSLVGHFVATPTVGAPPLPVSFTGFQTGTNSAQVYYRWDFQNDGTNDVAGLNSNVLTFVYSNSGIYSVRLFMSNAVGEAFTLVRTNYIFVESPHYVATNGAHVSPFSSWSQAATSLAAAVAVTGPRGHVFVSNGTFRLPTELAVTNPMTITAMNGPSNTTLLGTGTSRCLRIVDGVSLSGFTISGGNATGATVQTGSGGAVYLDQGGLISNCVLRGNQGRLYGGAFCAFYGGTILNSTLSSNTAALGGGAAFYQGGLISHAVVTSNTASDTGGGVYCFGLSVVRNCLLAYNTAGTNGGGAAISLSGGNLQSCTVVSNQAQRAGGVYLDRAGKLDNTVVYFNSASVSGPNWATNSGPSEYDMNFNAVCTTPTNALPNAVQCTSNDPLFVAAGLGDFRLAATSPGLNAGLGQPWMIDGVDLDGEPRILESVVDLGAYEILSLLVDITNAWDGLVLPFRSTRLSVAGRAINVVGTMTCSNRWTGGVVTQAFATATNWTVDVPLPRYGEHVITVRGTNAAGSAASDTVTLTRRKNQVFMLGR